MMLPLFLLLATACGRPADSADFRAFAPQVEDAIARKDIEFFARRAVSEVRQCPAPDLPVCNALLPNSNVQRSGSTKPRN